MMAKRIKKRLGLITQGRAFAAATPKQALRLLHDAALAACVSYSESEYGYGPARLYRFADGSELIDDGRGYTCEESPRA